MNSSSTLNDAAPKVMSSSIALVVCCTGGDEPFITDGSYDRLTVMKRSSPLDGYSNGSVEEDISLRLYAKWTVITVIITTYFHKRPSRVMGAFEPLVMKFCRVVKS